MGKSSEIEDVVIVGKLDLYEDPETGNDLVAVYTADGEEYVITNRKMVRKLLKYTEDDIDIEYTGTVREDPYSHIKVITVESYRLLQEYHELKPIGPIPEEIYSAKHAANFDELDESILGDDDLDAKDFDDEDFAQDDFDDEEAYRCQGSEDSDPQSNAQKRDINSVMADNDDFEKLLDIDLRNRQDDEEDEEDALSPEEQERMEKEFEEEMKKISQDDLSAILPDIKALKNEATKASPPQKKAEKHVGKAEKRRKTDKADKEETEKKSQTAKPKRKASPKKKED